MNSRNILLLLHIGSLILLGFGWTLDMLHINISTDIIMKISIFDEKRSVIGTLQNLWKGGNYWPFALIFFFGIIVPLFKSGVIFYLLLARNPQPKWRRFTSAISKWAMADVFAIAIFTAFLGANAMDSTKADLEPGFYYFSVYVLLSGVIAMLLPKLTPSSAPIDR